MPKQYLELEESREIILTIEEAFGLTLQQLRKAHKISQERLGFESGYHRTYISQLERGQKSPSLRTVFQLATVLMLTPSEIVLRVENVLLGEEQLGERSDENCQN